MLVPIEPVAPRMVTRRICACGSWFAAGLVTVMRSPYQQAARGVIESAARQADQAARPARPPRSRRAGPSARHGRESDGSASLAPNWRLTQDSNRSPSLRHRPTAAARPAAIGRADRRRADGATRQHRATSIAPSAPPIAPDQVLFGLIAGQASARRWRGRRNSRDIGRPHDREQEHDRQESDTRHRARNSSGASTRRRHRRCRRRSTAGVRAARRSSAANAPSADQHDRHDRPAAPGDQCQRPRSPTAQDANIRRWPRSGDQRDPFPEHGDRGERPEQRERPAAEHRPPPAPAAPAPAPSRRAAPDCWRRARRA